jgi:hypothetical protein
MLLNVPSLGATQPSINKAVDRAWIVKGSGGGSRPSAVENVDFRLSESDTKLEILVHQYLAYRMLYSRAAKGRNLCFRVYFPFETQIAVWGAGNAFSTWYPAGWHLVQCEYMTNGYCRYTIDGVVRYTGTIFGVPDFYGVGRGTVLFDIGNRGGTPPQYYEWW